MTSGGNNYKYFPENQLTKLMYFSDRRCVRTLRTLYVVCLRHWCISMYTTIRVCVFVHTVVFRPTCAVHKICFTVWWVW